MHRSTLFALPLLAACTVGTAEEGVDPRPMPLLLGESPVGSYQDRTVSLDPEIARQLSTPEAGDQVIAVELSLEIGGASFAVDPADPVVAIPDALEPGAELTLVVTAGGVPAELSLTVADPATAEDELHLICSPIYYPGYHDSLCGFPCASSQRYHEFWIMACNGCDPNNCWIVLETSACLSC